jgi:hypothetical protein
VVVVPPVPGVVAFGLVYGVLAREKGLNLAATTMMSVLVFPAILTGIESYWILRRIVGRPESVRWFGGSTVRRIGALKNCRTAESACGGNSRTCLVSGSGRLAAKAVVIAGVAIGDVVEPGVDPEVAPGEAASAPQAGRVPSALPGIPRCPW